MQVEPKFNIQGRRRKKTPLLGQTAEGGVCKKAEFIVFTSFLSVFSLSLIFAMKNTLKKIGDSIKKSLVFLSSFFSIRANKAGIYD